MNRAFTVIETLIGITFLAVIVGGILGLFMVVQKYFKDGIALAISDATARISIEKIVRPDVREGREFTITDAGDTLNLVKYDGTNVTFRYTENTLQRNGNTIGANIVKITGSDVFEEIVNDELIGINFGVRNEGISGHFHETHIVTQIKLRN